MASSTGKTDAVEMSQDWQTGKTTIAERAKHLLNSGLYTDCEFLVGAHGSNQEEKCLSLLQERTPECLASSDFEDAHDSMVLTIVKDEAMNISELELFDAVIRWARRQCTQRELEISGSNMRLILGDVIGEIRFLALTSGEFSTSPVLSGILSQEECMAIFMNLNNPGSWTFPLNLSACKTPRRQASNTFSSSTELRNGGRSTNNIGICCLLQIDNETLYHIEPSVKFITSFTVDNAVIIKGIVIAPLVLDDEAVSNGQDMVLYCHLLNSHGKNKTFARVSQPPTQHSITIEPVFDRPVRVKPGETYKIIVAVSQRAYFMTGMVSPSVSCQGVQFSFSVFDWSLDGLVRGVIFDL